MVTSVHKALQVPQVIQEASAPLDYKDLQDRLGLKELLGQQEPLEQPGTPDLLEHLDLKEPQDLLVHLDNQAHQDH
jgi:hypothetical protein